MKNKILTLLVLILLTFNVRAQFPSSPFWLDFPSCYGMCDGAIYIDSIPNAQYPLTYSIDLGATWVSSNVFSSLCEGNYTIYINDAYGISLDSIFCPLPQPDSLYPIITVSSIDTVLTAVGGMAPFIYTWQNGSSIVQPPYFPLLDSIICVTDVNGCITCDTPIVFNRCDSLYLDLYPNQKTSNVSLSLNSGSFPFLVFEVEWDAYNLTNSVLVSQQSSNTFTLNMTDTFFICVKAGYIPNIPMMNSDTCRVCDTIFHDGTSWILYNMISTSLNEIKQNKYLLKIVDVLGRETPYKKNTPLFYIYDDGTVEKRIILE